MNMNVLKSYMTVIYKITGSCKFDEFMDLGHYNEKDLKIIKGIEQEIINKKSKIDPRLHKIFPNIINVPGSLDKTILQAELMRKGADYRLRYEGLI